MLAVLTEPLSARPLNAVRNLLLGRRPLGGHYAVTRSLLAGLREIRAEHVYQPDFSRTRPDTAIVLAGVDTLRQALSLKDSGIMKRVLAGPNLVVRPTDADGVLRDERIDLVVVPSDWVRQSYEHDAPDLKGRIAVWAAGVDTEYWKPWGSRPRDLDLVYNKTGKKMADAHIVYGRYVAWQYRRLLNRARSMLMYTSHESQGIAMLEAWSMDVRTTIIGGPNAAPYFSDEINAAPRAFVLANMTDAICARKLLELAT